MNLVKRWNAQGGYGEALSIGLPLVVSMISNTAMTFTDRIFLGNYSLEALGAALPANVMAFLFLSFFMGVSEYVNVFIAQYTGACRPESVGRALWQGIWFCIPAGLFLASLGFIADPLFQLGGHPEELRRLEVVYFQILTVGSLPCLLGLCLSNFFAGRGLTKPVMLISVGGIFINIPLDYCLINGVGPFPEMGIAGAGLATVIGFIVPLIVYMVLIFTPRNERKFKVLSGWRFDRKLFGRFLKFGLPGGVQFFLDMFAISFFVFIVGRFGAVELASTSAVFSIYNLAFMPTIGLHVAASIMVGQAMGDGNPDRAAFATHSVLHLALAYMCVMAVVFWVMPEYLLNLFRASGDAGADFDAVLQMGRTLMRYAAVFTVCDAVVIVYMGGLKGAGDTRFIMLVMGTASIASIVIPMLVLSWLGITNIHWPWLFLLIYVIVLAVIFTARFIRGPWRRIDLIGRGDGPEMG
ncbi:MATE family efflux transporter [Pseudodesulfovibrio thermohalotolerans]|uniref:MATE family efflux transporter n=1 Tax=Pseudodesulfovibrio thermohalotolerans TaxID=2880651 RepID=UPI0024425FC0|nr:MATE family efflux transporter [Pseudodesulfovibrio thermohalotolerans]WFS62263.1 MATE family efflux transporter [Pseudodesulfovibrio thermohalotolerans]